MEGSRVSGWRRGWLAAPLLLASRICSSETPAPSKSLLCVFPPCCPPSRGSLAIEEQKLKSEVSVKCVGAVTQLRIHNATEHVSREVQLERGQRGKRKSSFTFPPVPAALNHTASGSCVLAARHEAWGSSPSAAPHVLLTAPSSQAARLSYSDQLTSVRTRLQFPSVNWGCPGMTQESRAADCRSQTERKMALTMLPSRMHARYTQTLH